jgi:hypothetical protein
LAEKPVPEYFSILAPGVFAKLAPGVFTGG